MGASLLATWLSLQPQALTLAVPAPEPEGSLFKDGSWARYHVVHTLADGTERLFKLTISSVGETVQDGEPCRWIEIDEKYEAPERSGSHKLLVPIKQLRESAQPFERILRYLTLYQGTAQERDPLYGAVFGAYMVFLPSVLEQAKKWDEPKEVDYQRGKLHIASGWSGTHVWIRRAKTAPITYTYAWDYKVWVHDDIPMGFAHAKMKLSRRENDDVLSTDTVEFFLEETGTNARAGF
jgi:hypothetical protein